MFICTCQDSLVSLFHMGNASSKLSCFHCISSIPTYIWRVEFKIEESAFWVIINLHVMLFCAVLFRWTFLERCRSCAGFLVSRFTVVLFAIVGGNRLVLRAFRRRHFRVHCLRRECTSTYSFFAQSHVHRSPAHVSGSAT